MGRKGRVGDWGNWEASGMGLALAGMEGLSLVRMRAASMELRGDGEEGSRGEGAVGAGAATSGAGSSSGSSWSFRV